MRRDRGSMHLCMVGITRADYRYHVSHLTLVYGYIVVGQGAAELGGGENEL